MKPRILVIDDVSFTAICLEGLVGDEYEIEHSLDAESGIALASVKPPDLILMDVEMPDLDGYAACTRLKQNPATAEIPVVFLSAKIDADDRLAGYGVGGEDYIGKPFDPEELSAKIGIVLRNHQKSRALEQQVSGMMNVLPHEFRTPLSAILGYAELMASRAQKGLAPAKIEEFSNAILRAGKTLLSHTTRFLTLVEYQGLKRLPVVESFAISETWCRQVIDELLSKQPQAGESTVDIQIGSALLRCPEFLVRTMLEELLSNASKFALPGTVIRVAGYCEQGGYRLDISNEGRAFPVEGMQQLGAFIQFEREQHEQQGLGIGLAMVSQALRLSAGDIAVHNLPAGRVSVQLTLPLTNPPNS